MKEQKIKKPKDKKTLEIFSTRFSERLDKSGLSQKAFALDIHISESAITKYKNGEMLPNMEILEKISNRLGVSVQYLLGKSEVPIYSFEDINKKIGLSQNAIETLYKIQHGYFELEENFEVNIDEEREISENYKEELQILSKIIGNSIYLIDMLYNLKKYKSKTLELQSLIKSYKETKDNKIYLKILDTNKEKKFLKYSSLEIFSSIVDNISKEE